jgi:VWFA-related protein
MKTIIKKGRVVTVVDDYQADILIEDEKFSTGLSKKLTMRAVDRAMVKSSMKKFFAVVFFVLSASFLTFAQTPAPAPTPEIIEEGDVVKINTDLIQVDVIVTDPKGRIVKDLRSEEIEIFENTKKQTITNFSFIDKETGTIKSEKIGRSKTPSTITTPPVNLKPEQVRRTIAIVIDDLSLSFQSVYYVRQALRKFVNEQMQPGDLVSIIRTGKGVGALQQFTSDKRPLYAAIEKVQWNPIGFGNSAGAFDPIRSGEQASVRLSQTPGRKPVIDSSKVIDSAAEYREFRENTFAAGTIGAINYVVRGLGTMPGRKSIILFSEGFSLRGKDGAGNRVAHALLKLIGLANRSSVAIYTMDVRGLMNPYLNAADDTIGFDKEEIEERLALRSDNQINNLEGLQYLANSTGGIAYSNSNDLSAGIEKAVNDQNGYYLVGYQPDSKTFDRQKSKFNTLTVKVNRPDLSVRYRSGYFGVADEAPKPERKTPQDQIFKALNSPFATGEIIVKLTPLFSRLNKRELYVNTLLHVRASDLKFTDLPDGWKQTSFDIAVLAVGDEGTIVEQSYSRETFKVSESAYEKMIKEGFVYTVQFPMKKPGAYQMRVALRDVETARIGSASQFIEIPDIKKNALNLSGAVLQQVDLAENQASRQKASTAARQDTALRQFQAGATVSYNLIAYSSRIEPATGQPKLKTQVNIFHNGTLIYAGKETEFTGDKASGADEVFLGGAIQFGPQMEPGEYMMQIVVTDMLAGQKSKLQWLDFEIVGK